MGGCAMNNEKLWANVIGFLHTLLIGCKLYKPIKTNSTISCSLVHYFALGISLPNNYNFHGYFKVINAITGKNFQIPMLGFYIGIYVIPNFISQYWLCWTISNIVFQLYTNCSGKNQYWYYTTTPVLNCFTDIVNVAFSTVNLSIHNIVIVWFNS